MKKKLIALKPFNNSAYYKNAIFNERSSTGSYYLIAARRLLTKRNIIMNTIDIAPNTPTLKDIYMDIPYPWELKHWIRIIRNIRKNILFMGEPPIVNPFNHMKIFHIFFSKVYTWNDNIVDNVRYFKYYLPVITKNIKTKNVPFKDKVLLIMMNMNWSPFLPFKLLSLSTKELYTERIKAVDFFDTYYPHSFSLYGRGWNRPRRFSVKQKLFGYKKYKTYKGEFHAKDKYKILSKFKFCLCFENCEIAGNFSEKMIDCFKASCVPIYWGASDIDKLVPKSCYIDFREFKNYKKLYAHLRNMKESEHNAYIQNIRKLMQDKKFLDRWSDDKFARFFLQSLEI